MMKRKKLIIVVLPALLLGMSLGAQAVDEELMLPCLALMCLSTGEQISECEAPRRTYFSIRYKDDWPRTVKARTAFLNRCPKTGDSTTQQETAELIDVITQGAGRCNSGYLNVSQQYEVNDSVYAIASSKPNYCTAYENNKNTYLVGTTYVGEPMRGGHWVDEAATVRPTPAPEKIAEKIAAETLSTMKELAEKAKISDEARASQQKTSAEYAGLRTEDLKDKSEKLKAESALIAIAESKQSAAERSAALSKLSAKELSALAEAERAGKLSPEALAALEKALAAGK